MLHPSTIIGTIPRRQHADLNLLACHFQPARERTKRRSSEASSRSKKEEGCRKKKVVIVSMPSINLTLEANL